MQQACVTNTIRRYHDTFCVILEQTTNVLTVLLSLPSDANHWVSSHTSDLISYLRYVLTKYKTVPARMELNNVW